jgi:protein TonB
LSPFIYLTIKRLTAPPKQEVKADLVEILQEDKIIEQPKKKNHLHHLHLQKKRRKLR